MGGGEGEGGDVYVSSTLGYGFLEFLDKLNGITDEKGEFATLVLTILAAIYCKEMYAHFDLLL